MKAGGIKRKILSMVLTLAMVLSTIPWMTMTSRADDENHNHDDVTFEAWYDPYRLPSEAGSYHLFTDVEIHDTWTVPSGTTNLCLNGFGIRYTGSADESVIIVPEGATLNIYDCNSTDRLHIITLENWRGTAVDLYDSTDSISESGDGGIMIGGGYITGGKGTPENNNGYFLRGGAVFNRGTLNLHGGTIIGNTANCDLGFAGGVFSTWGSTLNLYENASIRYNYAGNGGGGVELDGTGAKFTMSGGAIENNRAAYNGGGVIAAWGAGFEMTGGAIRNNSAATGGLVIDGDNTTFTVSGKPVVSGNTGGNLYLTNGHLINVNGELINGASIRVAMETPGVFTSGYNTNNSGKDPDTYFRSDINGYSVAATAAKEAQLAEDYTVTYNANGGSGAPNSQSKVVGRDLTLSSTVPTRDGYTFLGWAADRDAAKAEYRAGGTYSTDSDITLYAIWAKTESVIGNVNNTSGYGTATSEELTLTDDQVATFTFTNYSRKMYNWDNWATLASNKKSGDSLHEYGFRADAFVLGGTGGTVTNNYNFDTFREEMDGAAVKITVAFLDGYATTHVNVTAANGNTYYEEYTERFTDDKIYTWLTVDNSHIEDLVTSVKPIDHINVGNPDNHSRGGRERTEQVKLNEGQSVEFSFKHYNNVNGNFWENWIADISNDTVIDSSEWVEYAALRADAWDNRAWSNDGVTHNYNFDTFMSDLNEADTKIRFSYSDGSVTIRADITTKDGREFYEEYTREVSGTVRVWVTAENSHFIVSKVEEGSKENISASAENVTVTYDGKAHGITVNVTDPVSGAEIAYGTSKGNYDQAVSPSITNVSDSPLTVYYKVTADGYNTLTGSATVTINKADTSVTVPTAKTLTYSGTAQALVDAGSAEFGTMEYSLDNENWSEDIPEGTETGEYTVYYRVKGDSNHKDVAADTVTVNIQPKPTFKVTFDVGSHGQAPDDQTITSGEKITEPAAPAAEGYTFVGWYKDAGCTNKWNFDTDTVVSNTTLYALWTENYNYNNITFIAWTADDSLPAAAGNYYLTKDVTISSGWTAPGGTTNLHFRGHGIRYSGDDDCSAITVPQNGTLNIYDSDDASSEEHYITLTEWRGTAVSSSGNEVSVSDSGDGVIKVTGGYITGGKGTPENNNGYFLRGGAVFNRGTLNLHGGTIIGNTANCDLGFAGGVFSTWGSTLNLYENASIRYNYAGNGGGGVELDGTGAKFTMSGGAIENNRAAYNGGGVIAAWGAGFEMTGGAIRNNSAATGGLVIDGDNTTFTVSGKPVVSGNTGGNLYLTNGHLINVNGALTSGASVGVTMAAETGTFTSGYSNNNSNAEPSEFFISDNDDYEIEKKDNGEAALVRWTHIHDDITFTKWTSGASLPSEAGNYCLTQNVTLTSVWDVPSGETNLCLGGYSIIAAEGWKDDQLISIGEGAELSLYDDPASEGKVKLAGTNKTGTGIALESESAVLNMFGGTVSGWDLGISASGTFTMTGGCITGNNTGVSILADGIYKLSGDPVFGNNDEGDVYLADEKTIEVTNSLTNAEPIIIRMSKPGVFTGSSNVKFNSYEKFESYDSGYYIDQKSDRQLYLVEKSAVVHKHDDEKTFAQYWDRADSLPAESGSYYLTCDVTMSGSWMIPNNATIDLCINGKKITFTDSSSCINIGENSTLNIYNDEGSNDLTAAIRGKGTAVLYSGKIDSPGIDCGKLIINGGKITVNSENSAAISSDLIINDGSVKAVSNGAAGISGSVTANGGIVKTTGRTSGITGEIELGEGRMAFGGETAGDISAISDLSTSTPRPKNVIIKEAIYTIFFSDTQEDPWDSVMVEYTYTGGSERTEMEKDGDDWRANVHKQPSSLKFSNADGSKETGIQNNINISTVDGDNKPDGNEISGFGQYFVVADGCRMVAFVDSTYYPESTNVEYSFVRDGGLISAPEVPVHEGHNFLFWGDSDSKRFDFSKTVKESVVLYAVYSKKAYYVLLGKENDYWDTYKSYYGYCKVNYGETVPESLKIGYTDPATKNTDTDTFVGWVLSNAVTIINEDGSETVLPVGSKFDVNTPVTCNISLKAKFEHTHKFKEGRKIPAGNSLHYSMCKGENCSEKIYEPHSFGKNGKCTECGFDPATDATYTVRFYLGQYDDAHYKSSDTRTVGQKITVPFTAADYWSFGGAVAYSSDIAFDHNTREVVAVNKNINMQTFTVSRDLDILTAVRQKYLVPQTSLTINTSGGSKANMANLELKWDLAMGDSIVDAGIMTTTNGELNYNYPSTWSKTLTARTTNLASDANNLKSRMQSAGSYDANKSATVHVFPAKAISQSGNFTVPHEIPKTNEKITKYGKYVYVMGYVRILDASANEKTYYTNPVAVSATDKNKTAQYVMHYN